MSRHFSWQAAVLDSELEATTKFVLMVIGTHMNQHGSGAFPSYATIAGHASLNRTTVIRHVELAVQAGWIVKQQRMRPSKDDGRPEADSNLYGIAFPVVAQDNHPVAPSNHPGGPGQPPVVAQDNPNTPAITPQLPPQFIEAWNAYPKRGGGNSRAEALKSWKARVKAGANPDEITDGVKRYAAFVEATGKVGTEYVKQAASFFGPSEHYLERWDAPTRAAQRQTGHNRDFTSLDYDAPDGFRHA